ncbi:MAG: penicillin acylase family protein, partial [Chloroflexota bacterium]
MGGRLPGERGRRTAGHPCHGRPERPADGRPPGHPGRWPDHGPADRSRERGRPAAVPATSRGRTDDRRARRGRRPGPQPPLGHRPPPARGHDADLRPRRWTGGRAGPPRRGHRGHRRRRDGRLGPGGGRGCRRRRHPGLLRAAGRAPVLRPGLVRPRCDDRGRGLRHEHPRRRRPRCGHLRHRRAGPVPGHPRGGLAGRVPGPTADPGRGPPGRHPATGPWARPDHAPRRGAGRPRLRRRDPAPLPDVALRRRTSAVRRIARLARLIVGLLVVVAIVVGLLLGWIVGRAFPQRDGTVNLAGLSAAVTVLRDTNDIPQIYASTPADLFMAEGYVHASERMWQMEVWRHISSGSLSELFGKSEIKTDSFIRTLGWRQSAARDYAAASPDAKAALAAYAKGVNAWLATHKELSLPFVVAGFLGPGGGLAGYQPAPWDPVDSMAWAKVEAWQLGGNMDTEIFDLLLSAKVDPAAVKELSPAYPKGMPVIVPTGAAGSGGAGASGGQGSAPRPVDPTVVAAAGSSAAQADLLDLLGLSDAIGALTGLGPSSSVAGSGGIGSNDWVVSGAHTVSGTPMLANDPHLAHSMPSLWFMVGLHCQPLGSTCPYDVSGVSFPGDPGVILGHDARIAWGFTNVDPDVQDLFVEKVDPMDPTRYEYKGQLLPFTTRLETIKVAGGAPVTIKVRSTIHGPVISDVEDDLKAASAGGGGLAGGGLAGTGVVYALRWTATAEVGHDIEAILQLDRATDFRSFRAALANFDAPAQNVVYADVDGHIGYQMPGRIPIRNAGDGSLPVPGWTGAYDWSGYVPRDQLPFLYDPPSGIIATANNATVDSRFPIFIGDAWDPGYRAARIL